MPQNEKRRTLFDKTARSRLETWCKVLLNTPQTATSSFRLWELRPSGAKSCEVIMFVIPSKTLIGVTAFCSAWLSFADVTLDRNVSEPVIRPVEVPYGTLERDRRLCAYPLCGGYLIRSVNAEDPNKYIHVNVLDFSNYGPEVEKLVESHLAGHVIIKGKIKPSTGLVKELKVTDVYTAQRGLAVVLPKRTFIKASSRNPPINCVTAPCPNLLAEILNTQKIVDFDRFDTSLLPNPVAEKSLLSPKAILAGAFEEGTEEFPGGYELLFSVSAVYRQVPPKVVLPGPAD